MESYSLGTKVQQRSQKFFHVIKICARDGLGSRKRKICKNQRRDICVITPAKYKNPFILHLSHSFYTSWATEYSMLSLVCEALHMLLYLEYFSPWFILQYLSSDFIHSLKVKMGFTSFGNISLKPIFWLLIWMRSLFVSIASCGHNYNNIYVINVTYLGCFLLFPMLDYLILDGNKSMSFIHMCISDSLRIFVKSITIWMDM